MTNEEMFAVVSRITYKPGWHIGFYAVAADPDSRPYVQITVSTVSDATMDPTGRTSERTPWKSGKRYLSPHMCRQEVVGAVFDLIKAAEMHETHEWFRYRGASIYNPHLDPDVLAVVARRKDALNVRENAMDPA